MSTKARTESNAWIRDKAAKLLGRVLSIGSRDDSDGQGDHYRSYFCRADSYTTSEPTTDFACDLVLDVQSMPELDSDSWDVVFCSGVLEHVPSPEAAVSEMSRVLKFGGVLLIGVPFRQAIHMPPNDFWRFTEFGLRTILRRHSLEILELVAIQDDMKDFPVAYWALAKKRSEGDRSGQLVNAFYSADNLKDKEHWVEKVRSFHPDLRRLMTQPEIGRVRDWEYAAFAESLSDWVPGKKVLDLGCGRSLFAGFIKSLGADVATLDLPDPMQPQSAAIESRRKMGIEHHYGDMRKMNFGDGAFDLVVSISAIEHLHELHENLSEFENQTICALVEMCRVIRPGGRLFITSDVVDYNLQKTDAWRPGKQVSAAYSLDSFSRIFINTLREMNFHLLGEQNFNTNLLRATPRGANYRGRYFSTFAILAERSVTQSHNPMFPLSQ